MLTNIPSTDLKPLSDLLVSWQGRLLQANWPARPWRANEVERALWLTVSRSNCLSVNGLTFCLHFWINYFSLLYFVCLLLFTLVIVRDFFLPLEYSNQERERPSQKQGDDKNTLSFSVPRINHPLRYTLIISRDKPYFINNRGTLTR